MIKNLKGLSMQVDIKYALSHLINIWEQHTVRVKEIDAQLELQAKEDSTLETIYRSAPGIGPTGARILANELEDMAHFENERQLFSYTGLTPSEHSSGGHIRKGHISRQGKAMIRKILVLAAWKAIQKNRSLKEAFERMAIRGGVKKAIVGIARRLIGHLRACFTKRCLYWKEEEILRTEVA